MQEFSKKLHEKLTARKWMLATAESCTAGLLSASLTHNPGSSEFFDRGFVTYSNQSKIDLLAVSAKTLEKYGAVSPQIAEEMAMGVLNKSRAHLGISITGIAGPDGGSDEKPVGLVYFGLAIKGLSVNSHKVIFEGSRGDIRTKASIHAIKLLLDVLKDNERKFKHITEDEGA